MKSTAGFILSLIGGILDILAGILGIIVVFLLILTSFGLDLGSTAPKLADLSNILIIVFILVSLWFLIAGIISIIFSVKINNNASVKSGSIGCLIFGILTVNLLLIIGGIIGLRAVKKSSWDEQEASSSFQIKN